ncbi:MAG: hypothetical protein EZS28_015439 [Streblomastix strix]|uniref:Uncharacterized protein n=1 Tax=Streblomastix strix TaxID=222440 RepID=A0A5J4W3F4_9EUKA|nr:MAG: hypothetical protein EZS28_015439 [Streblomastix strix]
MTVAQGITAALDGIMKIAAEKKDMLNCYLKPIQREKLFEKFAWSAVNVIFPVHKVEPALLEENSGLARSAHPSSVAQNQGDASMIEDIIGTNSNKIVNKIFKVWVASFVSVEDAQTQCESRLNVVYSDARTEDILSQSSKERFKRIKSGKRVIIQNQNKGSGVFNRLNYGIFKRRQDDQRVMDFKRRLKFGIGN